LPTPATSASASPKPSASISPASGPSPRPTPIIILYDNYLAKIVVHDTPREGYSVPVKELERLGARTIGDVLRFVPGVIVRQTGTAGALQTVALRGDSAAQTLILLDGRPVNEGDTGVTDFTSMPLDGVQGITVIEGGLSSRYGSGAIGGVVEISTRNSHWRDSAYVQTGYQGEFGSGIGVSAGGFHGGVRVDAFTRWANNTFDYPSFLGIAGGTRSNNDFHASDVTLCACFQIGMHVGADLHYEDNASTVGVPGSTQFGPAFVSANARQQRYIDRTSLNLHYVTLNALTTAIFYVDGRRLHFYDTTPSFPFDTMTTATQRGFSLMETVRTEYYNTVTLKYEQNGTVADFQGTFNTPSQLIAATSTTDFYVGDIYESHREGPEVNAAVQVAHTQGIASTALPSFAVKQPVGGDYAFGGGSSVRASYARSFRAPNLDELYFPSFGNPKLQPEYASTFDVGVLTANDLLDGSATLFGSDTNNLIVNQATDMMGNFLPFNVGRARVRGYSLQLSNARSRRLGAQVSFTAYPAAKDLSTVPDINGVVTSGNRLLYRPTTTTGLEIWRYAGYDPQPHNSIGEDGVDLLVIGRQYADEENTILLPPYATLGLHVSRNLTQHLTLLLRVDNLTGERVPQVYGYPVLPTTLTVRLTAR